MTSRVSSRLSTCLSRPVLSALLAGTCSLVAYAPRLAAACAPPLPGLTGSIPADGATYPANAALLFSGFYIKADALKVTVDGVGAELVPADLPSGFATLAVVVQPQPQPGQTVAISGSFCPEDGCEETTLTFTAGELDLVAPAPNPAAAFFGVYDHTDFVSSGGDCQSDSDITFYLHLEQSPVGEGGAPELVSAEWNGEGSFGGSRRTADGSEVLAMSVVASQLAGADPNKDVCFTVTLRDAAGNAAEPYEVCPACFFRKDDLPLMQSTPEEPAWTDADAVPGSACAGGGETTGDTTGDTSGDTSGDSTGDPETGGTTEDPTDSGPDPTGSSSGDPQTTGDPETSGPDTGDQQDDDKGCACDSDTDAPAAPTLAALALLMLIRPRRRA
jgi:MYXO-CTERM domain-containing protein